MDAQIQAGIAHTAISEMTQRPSSKSAPVQSPKELTPAKSAQESAKSTQKEITREVLDAATKKVQSFVEAKTSELQFAVDDASGVQVVRVFDKGTKELIRQIPSQEVVEMAAALEQIQGLLLKQKA